MSLEIIHMVYLKTDVLVFKLNYMCVLSLLSTFSCTKSPVTSSICYGSKNGDFANFHNREVIVRSQTSAAQV